MKSGGVNIAKVGGEGQFSGKRSNWGNSPRSPKNLSETGGNLKQREMHHCLRGGWTPLNELIQRTFGQAIDHYPSMAPSIKTSVSAESPCAQQTQVAIIS